MGADLWRVTPVQAATLTREHEYADVKDIYENDAIYFRDAYNGLGLFAQIGLSWWRDVSDKLQDGQGFVEPGALLALLQKARLPDAPREIESGWQGNKVTHVYTMAPSEVRERCDKLVAFCEAAIANNQRIYASL